MAAFGGGALLLAVAVAFLAYGLAASVASVTEVRFTLEGQPVDVPRGDGTLSPGPLTTLDYASLRGL